ncbi:Nif3-like dinuclear metal center hexameric protein [Bacillus cytotoxicus]|uniref:Nif3-like dinuclear metal center hexameric protein n=1 Tax=Bacillus cytotoxicus TaxID=580165 RepID=A0ACC6A3R2_9BACI|nr:Nif3-like dinuclear metal center hexameric protein [Bacillus cytotoxicus]
MPKLQEIEHQLHTLFSVHQYGVDPGFSRFLPAAYDSISFPWQEFFEDDFVTYFNGLMLKGADVVRNVFLAVFPTDEVLDRFLTEGTAGDLLFMHHPLVMECGDPHGLPGRGFIPIPGHYLRAIKEKGLSVYTCHAPMDIHQTYGTSIAIAKALQASVIESFAEGDGLICEVAPTNTNELIEKAKRIFDIPYVDFEGKTNSHISKIAIIAGCGDKVSMMQEAEEKGAQAYITGEVHCHIDNDYGKKKYDIMKEHISHTNMSLIGVSHSASEYLVKKTLMYDWFSQNFNVNVVLLPQEKWWY